ILQLAEYSAGAEERDCDTDHGSDSTGRRLAGARSDVLHRFGAAAIEERMELVKDLSAGDFAVAVDEAKNSSEHPHHGREGKHRVIGQSCPELGLFILQPMPERSLKQADGIRQ